MGQRFAREITKIEADHALEIRQLHNQIHQLSQGFDTYQARIEELVADKQAMLAQIAGLRGVRTEIEACYDKAEEFAARFETMAAQIALLESDLADRDGRVARLQREVDRIKASPSYRLATPLRAFQNGRNAED